MPAIESAPNIGKVLGQRLRAVGIETREELCALGETVAFQRLVSRFPEEACAHTRRAIAGAVRGVRHWHLGTEILTQIKRDYPSSH